MGRFQLRSISLAGANDFVAEHHRHHKKVQGHKFSLAAWLDGKLVGVSIVGRPVARRRDDGLTVEVTRLCTDGSENACSFLYGASVRAAKALGYDRCGTYIAEDEPGTTLKAAGWKYIHSTPGKSWSVPSRARDDKTELKPRSLYEWSSRAANDNSATPVAASPSLALESSHA
jgi:hypothetical protein